MADRDESEDLIRNEDTRMRRAWVDRALTGVRRRLECGGDLADGAIPPEGPEAAARPQLVVVPTGNKR